MAKAKKVGRPKIKDRKTIKEHVISVRFNLKEREDLRKAASLYDWAPREFMKNVTLAMIEKALKKEQKNENRIITLSPRQRDH